MTNIQIKETGEIQTLTIIDPASGIDWSADCIGNSVILDDTTQLSDDDAVDYVMTRDAYDWWARHLDAQQAVDDRRHAMQLTDDETERLRDAMPNADLDQMPSIEQEILDDIAKSRGNQVGED